MMTRRDFESIAAVLDANHAPYPIVCDMADMLEEDNPRFDRSRFIDAASNNIREDAKRLDRMLEREIAR